VVRIPEPNEAGEDTEDPEENEDWVDYGVESFLMDGGSLAPLCLDAWLV
jgi:hypothetical protein